MKKQSVTIRIKNWFYAVIAVFVFAIGHAQFSGNQVYKKKNQYDYKSLELKENFGSTDSTLVFNAKILLNQVADQYKLTLGVSEEAENPKKSIEKINSRINQFIAKTASIGIKKEDVFVDFISQTKIYDFDLEKDKNVITQKIKGFEIKKNIIITVNDYSKIEKLMYEASDFQIYDIIKVDYINNNIEKIQQNLLKEAYSIIDQKKEDYFRRFHPEIVENPISSSSFTYIFPNNQYEEYTAFESSDFDIIRGNSNTDNYIKKMERKGKTYYYEGIDYSGFDKIINNENPEIGIQYILNVNVKYKLKKVDNHTKSN